ncbi:MAG: hypothetical protein A3F17_01700 [Gammaproteobacteria bacterium RIFCSPHIGHO2_12_FULL_41_15]|nr:MAG: hypothetical protein A3F17_01700 [Gammaproteobacteria bacterium RIFCSPHIGHO2_12_FULL_41_15]
MKNMTGLAAITLTSMAITSAAFAEGQQPQPQNQGIYASIWGGVNIPEGQWADGNYILAQDETGIWKVNPATTGPAFGAALGYRFQQFRVESELSFYFNKLKNYNQTTSETVTINGVNFMLNGYVDIPMQSPLVPYVGAGIGTTVYSITSGDTVTTPDNSARFAVQGIAGVEYKVSPEVGVSAEYRLKYSTLNYPPKLSVYNNIIAARLNYYF